MVNEAQISLTGYVATQPVTKPVAPGVKNVSMRVAWTPRWRDRATGEWVDGNTSYVTVVCWRKLAANAAVSLRTGDPVVVMGRLSVRTYNDRNGVRKTAVDIDANTVGHDLSRGVSEFQRVRPKTGMTASEFEASQGRDGAGDAPAAGAENAGQDAAVPGGAVPEDIGPDSIVTAAPDDPAAGMPDEPDDDFFGRSSGSEQDAAPEPAAV